MKEEALLIRMNYISGAQPIFIELAIMICANLLLLQIKIRLFQGIKGTYRKFRL